MRWFVYLFGLRNDSIYDFFYLSFFLNEMLFVCSRLFSPELFEMFIDVGHYVREITAYEPLQEKITLLTVRD